MIVKYYVPLLTLLTLSSSPSSLPGFDCSKVSTFTASAPEKIYINALSGGDKDKKYHKDLRDFLDSDGFKFSNNIDILYGGPIFYSDIDGDGIYDFILSCIKRECVGKSAPVYYVFLSGPLYRYHVNGLAFESTNEPILLRDGRRLAAIGFYNNLSNKIMKKNPKLLFTQLLLINGGDINKIECD